MYLRESAILSASVFGFVNAGSESKEGFGFGAGAITFFFFGMVASWTGDAYGTEGSMLPRSPNSKILTNIWIQI